MADEGPDAEIWLARGRACQDAAQPAEAAVWFRRCLALDPCHVGALELLALLEASLERRLTAIGLFERLLAAAPAHHEAYVRLAHLEAALGWLDRALARFATLGRGLPGWWEQTRQDRLRAVRQQRQRLTLLVERRQAGERLGLSDQLAAASARLALGHLPACAAGLRVLLALDPAPVEARALMAALILRRDGLRPAIDWLLALPEDARAQPRLRTLLARLLHEAGDFSAVEALLGADDAGAAPVEALHLLTLAGFASGAQQRFAEAARRWMRVRNRETRPCIFAIAVARSQGRVRRLAGAAGGEPGAPIMLLQYWHDSEIPSDVADAMASWPGRNPGITHQVLSREAARQVLAEQGDADVLACFDEARHPAMQSDIIRLAMLARVGGLYVDADERCTAPVTPLLRALAEVDFIGWLSPETPPYVFNGFMAVRPGCPVILDALRDLTSLRAAHRKAGIASNIWEVSGPGLITRAVGRFVSEASHAERVMLLTDREWRRFAYTDETLAYKHAAGGNWRLT